MNSGFQVGPETFVTVSVVVHDAEGEAIAEPEVAGFVFGMGQMNPEIERSLEGRATGDNFAVKIGSEKAFGARDPERVLHVARDEFPPDVAEGDVFDLENASGALIVAHVLEVTEDTIVLDTNHPLADQEVTFRVVVLEVRPASDRELKAAEDEMAELAAAPPDVPLGSLIRRPGQG